MAIANPTPIVSERAPGKITLYFSPKQTPPTLPYELNGHVSADAWATRVPQILRLTSRYNNPRFEAVWMVMFFILAIALPAAINNIIFNAVNKGRPITQYTFVEAHAASAGLFIGIALLFWGPLLAFKALGQQRARVLARRWVAEDSRGTKYNGYVPLWEVTLPGVASSQTRVTINLPTFTSPTNFHPQAYLPSWIAGPTSPPLEKSPSLDGLPLYDEAGRPLNFTAFDEKAPAYTAADVKV